MNKSRIFFILCCILFLHFPDTICAQDIYSMKIKTFVFGDGFVRNIKPHEVKKLAHLNMRFNRSPWAIEFDDFIDSLKAVSELSSDFENKSIANKDFRIYIVIRHKYLFFIKHEIYCDRFGFEMDRKIWTGT
jgi:hypothetical protein